MADWYSVDDEDAVARLTAAWLDAPVENEERLGMLLEIAKDQVIACAPEPAEENGWATDPPSRFVEAQLQVVRKSWSADQATSDGGEAGAEGYTWTPYQRDRYIRELIRPKDMKPHVL